MKRTTIITTILITLVLASSALVVSQPKTQILEKAQAETRDIAGEKASYTTFAQGMIDYLESLTEQDPSLDAEELFEELADAKDDIEAATNGDQMDLAVAKLNATIAKIDNLGYAESETPVEETIVNSDLENLKKPYMLWFDQVNSYLYYIKETQDKNIDSFLNKTDLLQTELYEIKEEGDLQKFDDKLNELYEDIIKTFTEVITPIIEKQIIQEWINQTTVWVNAVLKHEIKKEEKIGLEDILSNLKKMDTLLKTSSSKEDLEAIYDLSKTIDSDIQELFPPLNFEDAKADADKWVDELNTLLLDLKNRGKDVSTFQQSLEGTKSLIKEATTLEDMDFIFSSLSGIEEEMIKKLGLDN